VVSRGDKGETLSTVLPAESAAEDVTYAKRPRLDSRIRRDFDMKVAKMNEWFEKTEVTLELLTEPSPNIEDRLTLEEQVVLVTVDSFFLILSIS
jgi:hypothetical protein